MQQTNAITKYLNNAKNGDDNAFRQVYELAYDDLKEIAHQRLAGFKRGETLNTTSLVHEAFLKLVDTSQHDWQDRAHFFAATSRAMRFILVDYLRAKTAQKRGGNRVDEPLNNLALAMEERIEDFISLNSAIEKLLAWNERLGKLVEYRFIGGMTYEEISEVTGLSEPTLKRDWTRARAWLYSAMKDSENSTN